MQNYITLDLSSQSLKTSYYEAGKKEFPTILMVHGNSSSKETFLKQIQSFKSMFHVVAVDLPGHGDTQSFTSMSYSFSNFSEFLVKFTQELGLEVNTLMGHSLGGHICHQALNLIKPNYLITSGAPPLTNPPVLEKVFTANPISGCFFKNSVSDSELQGLYETCFENRTSHGFIDFSNQFNKVDPSFRENFFNRFSGLTYKDEFSELEKFNGDVLFLCGAKEKIVNKEYFTENCFEYKLATVESSGHFSHCDNPDEFNLISLSFLRNKKIPLKRSAERSY